MSMTDMQNINYDVFCHIAENVQDYKTLWNLESAFRTRLPVKYFKTLSEKNFKICMRHIVYKCDVTYNVFKLCVGFGGLEYSR